nr:hypothetical protein [Tanacetum cinerariifolium]
MLIKRQLETESMLEEMFRDLCEEVSNFVNLIQDEVKDVERLSCKDVAKETVRLLRSVKQREFFKMTRLQENARDIEFANGLDNLWVELLERTNERQLLITELEGLNNESYMDPSGCQPPSRETPSFDGTTSEDIAEFEVASKSTSSTSKPKKVTAHKVVTQKVQTKSFLVKSTIPIKNSILGLAVTHTWACTGNKTFGTRKQKDTIVAGQVKKWERSDAFRLAFDPRKSSHYKVVQAGSEAGVWSIYLGEGEEDAFVVINLSGKVVKYNLISNTKTQIFDIRSNQMDDDDDDVDDLFIPPFEVDHKLYEFIPSFVSV